MNWTLPRRATNKEGLAGASKIGNTQLRRAMIEHQDQGRRSSHCSADKESHRVYLCERCVLGSPHEQCFAIDYNTA